MSLCGYPPDFDHPENPGASGSLIEMRLQQNATIAVNQMTQGKIKALRCSIDQLRPIVDVHLRHLSELFADIGYTAATNVGIGKDPDDRVQCTDFAIIETALRKCG